MIETLSVHSERTTAAPETGRLFVGVAVDGMTAARGGGVLSYEVPARWPERLDVGQLVWVPLRKSLALGVVVAIDEERPSVEVRPLHAPVEPRFRLSEDRFDVARWLARETACTLFAAASPFLPPGVTHRTVEYLRLAISPLELPADLTTAQRALAAILVERGEVSIDAARSATGQTLTTVIPKLEAKGVIERVARVAESSPRPRTERFLRLLIDDQADVARSPKQRAVQTDLLRQRRLNRAGDGDLTATAIVRRRTGADRATIAALIAKGVVEELQIPLDKAPMPRPAPAPMLTDEQARAWRAVENALERRDSDPLLLHGVTGSGKTEIYLRAVGWCLRHDRAAIVLVPEIGLATQVVQRFVDRFPGKVAVLHSALPDGERYATWQAVAAGKLPVVVGPRSALFAPLERLGLIVLDEEHEGTYKQESDPRYHARTLAEYLAAKTGAALVLGSATPAVETAWRANRGDVTRLTLASRIGSISHGDDGRRVPLALPTVEVVDMRQELHHGNVGLLSERLRDSIEATLRRKEQAILLLNRRGLATIVLCRACGRTLICPLCDVPMVYHRDRQCLICHRCNERERAPHACPTCGGGLNYFGAGTQRVEEEVRRRYPHARVLRWDQDSVRRQGGFGAMLARVERHEIDIVVGTQMVAKGFDLPLVTAIGVVQADTMLHLPDFRSGERTFQLLTQVAGRAGRRAPGSTVVVQSYTPEHYAIQAASRHDYNAFYAEEIDFRRNHGFPPFARLVRYLYRDPSERTCVLEAEMMARVLARHARARMVDAGAVDLLGPTPAFAAKLRGKYQWQLVLRAQVLEPLLDGLPVRPGWTVDVDPQSML
ncbi:MAG: primosomal protein N' [Chloroflexia bacterium]|nr:primosomal protein N' [Chloroflexia bacterium]